jgi:hypothetical protein
MLNRVIATVLQEDLLSMNLSTLIPDALKTGEYLEVLLEESIRAFQAAQVSPPKFEVDSRLGNRRTTRAKAG